MDIVYGALLFISWFYPLWFIWGVIVGRWGPHNSDPGWSKGEAGAQSIFALLTTLLVLHYFEGWLK